jgi:hypothetical protein
MIEKAAPAAQCTMAYPSLIRCAGCGSLVPLGQRCEGVKVAVKKLGQLEDVAQTELYSTSLYDCPFCGYSAFGQPDTSPWKTDEK